MMQPVNVNASASIPAAVFALSQSAAKRIAHLVSDEPPGTYFRVSVLGGGCSGFQYHFELQSTPMAEDDHLFEQDGVQVVVDEVSLGLLGGAGLDYTEDLSSAGFEIKNPNAKSGCGCGNSFSV